MKEDKIIRFKALRPYISISLPSQYKITLIVYVLRVFVKQNNDKEWGIH